MFHCTRTETHLILEGKCAGVVRLYERGTCPHKAGSQIMFASRDLPWLPHGDGRFVPFAQGTIVSVRPGTVGQFRNDPVLANQDGFANGNVWHGHLSQMLKGVGDDASVYHITFRLDEIDKKAGLNKAS